LSFPVKSLNDALAVRFLPFCFCGFFYFPSLSEAGSNHEFSRQSLSHVFFFQLIYVLSSPPFLCGLRVGFPTLFFATRCHFSLEAIGCAVFASLFLFHPFNHSPQFFFVKNSGENNSTFFVNFPTSLFSSGRYGFQLTVFFYSPPLGFFVEIYFFFHVAFLRLFFTF